MIAAADLPQHAAGATLGDQRAGWSWNSASTIFYRSAFKDAVLWYYISPVTPQFATWSVDMVVVAHNHFCCAERLSRQSLASFTCNDSGLAQWFPNEGCGCAHRADAGNQRSQLYVYALPCPCLWSFDMCTGLIWGP